MRPDNFIPINHKQLSSFERKEALVAKASGASRTTIHTGIKELKQCDLKREVKVQSKRIRRAGAGRKYQKETDETLLADMDTLLDPVTRGDPMSALRWTCKSTTKLAAELQLMGHSVSQATVWRLLDELDYSMQSNRKTREGIAHEDRDAHFTPGLHGILNILPDLLYKMGTAIL